MLVSLSLGALAVLALLVSTASSTMMSRPSGNDSPFYTARADTDSVAIADTITWPDSGRVAQYLRPLFRSDSRTASLAPREKQPFFPRVSRYWKHVIELDSTVFRYTTREYFGEDEVRYPVALDLDDYKAERLDQSLETSFKRLVEQSAQRQRQNQRRGGLGFNIIVPGGRESAFSTIFGSADIDLRVNGQANINAGFSVRRSDQQTAFTGRDTQVDPEFRQDLRLGIVGSIGDKMQIDVNWDTERDFDYQNQLKLQYTGYDDDIIKNIEAGNVFLNTPSSLIRGGQSLFGIKSEFQVGGIQFQTVISQQEGQANSLSIDGGSETVSFELRPTDYDEKTHFFLSYYFRNRWEEALETPPLVLVADNFERITDVELWKLQRVSAEELELRKVISVVDLGEEPAVRQEANLYDRAILPNPEIDAYDEATLSTEVLDALNVNEADRQTGDFFKKLERGRDYEIDEVLGYVSLNQRLQDNEALAVSFRYVAGGRVVQVGEFAADKPDNDERLVLKLLRPTNLRQPNPEEGFNPAAWYLEMRNIYRLQGRGINPNEFDLQVYFQPSGQPPQKTLPGVGRSSTLLQILGLDRLNVDEAPRPDDRFDYLVNYTIDPGRGFLIFPFLEPFSTPIEAAIEETTAEDAKAEAREKFVFSTLYSQKKENARRDTQLDVYEISGSYKGAVQSFYNLNAFSGVVEGSVRVTAGGTPLSEGTDYVVDYDLGTVSITNPAFLTAGRNIEIDYEQNSFFNIQKKTLLGARAYYEFEDKLLLGTTLMRLSQRSPVDKFRLGEEPIANTIWGVDGNVNLEPRWLTRAIDALPLIQTRAQSTVTLSGEFAQLRPGHTQTTAFRRSRRELNDVGRDFNDDELSGISYIDDFEGFETTFSLKQSGTWRLSSAPDSISADPTVEPDESLPRNQRDSLRTNWRATLGWYSLNINTLRQLEGKARLNEAVDIVQIREVFPERDTRGEPNQDLATLDFYFDPSERGPYNYTRELDRFLNEPKNTWGGMVQRLPEGFNDFSLKNIEFVEFIMRPFADGREDTGPDAKLYVDLGSISEDVIPNNRLNNEDGLSTATIGSPPDQWGRTPTVTPDNVVGVQDGRTEDLGLDGLASYDNSAYDPLATEEVVFSDFLSSLDLTNPDPRYQAQVQRILLDPSGDDYHFFDNDLYFGDTRYYPETPTLQQRFTRYFPGTELNAFETQNKLATNTSQKRGNAQYPDSEDLNLNSTVDRDNNYFQYEVPLSKQELDELAAPDEIDDYVVGKVTDAEGRETGWYLIRIPVQQPSRVVGDIQDFTLIESLRMWTTGHEVPATIRFATFELVGSQWRKADPVNEEIIDPAFPPQLDDTRTTISSINNEEDADIYNSPIGTVISQTRLATGGVQNAREQALVLRVENLKPGGQQAIFKTYPTPLDLLKYSNLRMFAHMHGELADGTNLINLPKDEARERVKFFIRLGSNETNDYYEYEQPLTPSDFTSSNTDDLWQTNQNFANEFLDLNSINILMSAFNQLKVTRDEFLDEAGMAFPLDSVFWNVDSGELRGPSADRFAPPGTRLGIRGTPSLGRVNSIVMGIRNPVPAPGEPGTEIRDVTVWLNELRSSGYDEENGWAALANMDVKMADFGRVKANFRRQTDGFGSLESSLGERDQNDINNWSVAADMNLDKFIPERFGWSIPVSGQIQSNTSTPRFAPSRGDVRLEEIVAQIRESDIDPLEKEERIQNAREAAQNFSYTRSFSFRMQKQNSRPPLVRILIDGLSFNYSYSDSDARTPSQKIRDSWRWNSNLGYRFSVRQPKTVRPFWFLEEVPLIGALGDLRFNYLPNSFTASASAARNFSETRQRAENTLSELEEDAQFPLREQHTFNHRRNASLQYNPFNFLNLTFDTDTNQSLNQLGVDTTFAVIDLSANDSLGARYANTRLRDAINQGLVDEDAVGTTVFQTETLIIKPASSSFQKMLRNDDLLRTEQHGQRFNATFQPNLSRSQALNWINIQPVSYQVSYSWQNAAAGRLTGASVQNQVSVRSGMTLRPVELWRKIPFYEKLENKQKEAEQEAQRKRREKEVARRERREARKQQREERRIARQEEIQREREEEERRKAAEDAGIPYEPPAEEIPEEIEDEEEGLPGPDSTVVEGMTPEQQRIAAELERLRQERGEAMEEETEGEEALPGAAPEGDGEEPLAEEESPKKRFTLPLPKPGSILRQVVLAATGIRDLTITYTATRNSSSSNIGIPLRDSNGFLTGVQSDYGLFDALLRNEGPSMRYRFGLDRRIPFDSRVITENLQVTDVLSDNNRIQGNTSLNPSTNLTINLNFNVDWGTNGNLTYRPGSGGIPVVTETERGSNRASVWAFGADYLSLFVRQFETYVADAERSANPAEVGDANGDGNVLLTSESLVEDFSASYIRGPAPLDRYNLLPFPLPGWRINYTGLSNWPIFDLFAQNVTLRHSYSADYSTDYRTNVFSTTEDSLAAFNLGGRQIFYSIPEVDPGAVRINERFQPFLGVDLSFKNQIQTNFAWNRSNSYSLSTTSFSVNENKTSELTFTASYQRRGLKLPFMKKKLDNQISFSLTFSRAIIDDKRLELRRALEAAIEARDQSINFDRGLALEGDNVSPITSSVRLTLAPQISYKFSNRVSGDFRLRYEKFDSEDSRIPSSINVTGTFNVRVSIQN